MTQSGERCQTVALAACQQQSWTEMPVASRDSRCPVHSAACVCIPPVHRTQGVFKSTQMRIQVGPRAPREGSKDDTEETDCALLFNTKARGRSGEKCLPSHRGCALRSIVASLSLERLSLTLLHSTLPEEGFLKGCSHTWPGHVDSLAHH